MLLVTKHFHYQIQRYSVNSQAVCTVFDRYSTVFGQSPRGLHGIAFIRLQDDRFQFVWRRCVREMPIPHVCVCEERMRLSKRSLPAGTVADGCASVCVTARIPGGLAGAVWRVRSAEPGWLTQPLQTHKVRK